MELTPTLYIVAQIFGFASMAASMWSQQFKKRETILIFFIIANLLNAIHFYLFGALTGTAMATIGAARFGVAIFSTSKWWLILFLIINTMATYLLFEGFLLSGTSYLAATFIIISSFLTSDHWMRVSIIVGSFGWLVYGGLIGSVIGIVSGALFFGSSVIGWYRHVYLQRNAAKGSSTQSDTIQP